VSEHTEIAFGITPVCPRDTFVTFFNPSFMTYFDSSWHSIFCQDLDASLLRGASTIGQGPLAFQNRRNREPAGIWHSTVADPDSWNGCFTTEPIGEGEHRLDIVSEGSILPGIWSAEQGTAPVEDSRRMFRWGERNDERQDNLFYCYTGFAGIRVRSLGFG
jgi:hypothetical protein